ncbi:MAG: pilus assembly protein PilP [Betaproteobacteria bacterium]
MRRGGRPIAGMLGALRQALGWLVAAGALGLTACSSPEDPVQSWAEQQRRQAKIGLQALPAPARFEPQEYDAQSGSDPFDTHKLTSAIKLASTKANPRMAAEQNRRREPLEAYELETMVMAGTLQRQGGAVALVSVDKLLYQVKVGDYMGQNNGRVVKIEEGKLELREVVQDGAGEWVERTASLQTRESKR